MATFDGDASKVPTNTTQYVFDGWEPALSKVSGEKTYTAKFLEQERVYKIDIAKNFSNAGAVSVENLSSPQDPVNYQEKVKVSATVNHGYKFVGWYRDGSFYSSNLSFEIQSVENDFNFEAKYDVITKTITYLETKGIENNNKTSYDIRDGVISLLPLSKKGYNFLGWWTESGGNGTKISQIDASNLQDIVLYANLELVEYSITYDLNGGSDGGLNPTTFNIESGKIVLEKPTKFESIFLGWTGTGLNGIVENVEILSGSTGDREYVAHFKGETKKIYFVVEGINLDKDTIEAELGQTVYAPDIDTSKYGMTGYSIDGWYVDNACQNKYVFDKTPLTNITLYGKWNYLIDDGFYSYIEKFSLANTLTPIEINSFNELRAYVEYVEFYDLTNQNLIKLTYKNLLGQQTRDEIKKAINLSTFVSNGQIGYSSSSTETSKGSVYVLSSYRASEGTKQSDPGKNYVYKQQDYALEQSSPGRAGSFNNFNINKINKQLAVETSNQLVYALEKGIRPICASGSKAENIYNKAKSVLKEICDDEMSDLQKIAAIYQWLVLNVDYDYFAAESEEISLSWQEYDSWFAEGVFNNNKAVCDGIAKAFVILSKIENIPAIRVSGNHHAWNKVYVNGAWFGIDATHGNMGIKYGGENYEIISHANFLFTDAFKVGEGYQAEEYPEITANTLFSFYDFVTLNYQSVTFDLLIESKEELALVFKFVKEYVATTDYFTFEIAMANGVEYGDIINYAENNSGLDVALSTSGSQTNSFGNKVYCIFVA